MEACDKKKYGHLDTNWDCVAKVRMGVTDYNSVAAMTLNSLLKRCLFLACVRTCHSPPAKKKEESARVRQHIHFEVSIGAKDSTSWPRCETSLAEGVGISGMLNEEWCQRANIFIFF